MEILVFLMISPYLFKSLGFDGEYEIFQWVRFLSDGLYVGDTEEGSVENISYALIFPVNSGYSN